MAQRKRLCPAEAQIHSGDEHTRQQADDFIQARCKAGLVEVVDVEIDKPVVALVTAEVLQMHVAADPSTRRRFEHAARRQALVEEVTGAAQKDKRRRAHALVLHVQALGVPAAIELRDLGCDIEHTASSS